jgi:hypothetical protein
MPRSPFRRKVAALALAGLCLASWLSASETRARPTARRSPAVAETPWSAVVRLWSMLSNLWAENGCHIDPNGLCAPASGTGGGSGQGVSADNGCSIDPDGCAKALASDNGCRLDPDGCAAAVELDNGCRIDPDGCAK